MKVGILITENINRHKYNVVKSIVESNKFEINGVYVDRKKTLTNKDKLKKNIRRGRGFYVFVMYFKKFFKSKEEKINVYESYNNNIIYDIHHLYDNETVEVISKNQHDILILINGYGIIKQPILSIAPYGVLSYHHGNIRKYRGMPPLFWEYCNGEKECGATVQRLSEKLDAGEIMAEKSFKIDYSKSFKCNKQDLYRKSESLMTEALEKVSRNENGITPNSFGKVYTLPNFREWVYFLAKRMKYKLGKG